MPLVNYNKENKNKFVDHSNVFFFLEVKMILNFSLSKLHVLITIDDIKNFHMYDMKLIILLCIECKHIYKFEGVISVLPN